MDIDADILIYVIIYIYNDLGSTENRSSLQNIICLNNKPSLTLEMWSTQKRLGFQQDELLLLGVLQKPLFTSPLRIPAELALAWHCGREAFQMYKNETQGSQTKLWPREKKKFWTGSQTPQKKTISPNLRAWNPLKTYQSCCWNSPLLPKNRLPMPGDFNPQVVLSLQVVQLPHFPDDAGLVKEALCGSFLRFLPSSNFNSGRIIEKV